MESVAQSVKTFIERFYSFIILCISCLIFVTSYIMYIGTFASLRIVLDHHIDTTKNFTYVTLGLV